MAEEPGQSRTEAPTQRRRDEARRQGRVAVSAELTNGVQLLAGVGALMWGGRSLARGLVDAMQHDLRQIQPPTFDPVQAYGVFVTLAFQIAGIVGFLLGLLLVTGLGASTLQVGFHVAPELLLPRWEKLSPVAGWSRLFSGAAAVRGLLAILKICVVAAVIFWVLKGRLTQIRMLNSESLPHAIGQAWDIAIRLALAGAAALALIGVADYTYQRLRHEFSLRMTRHELKEETKREEGDPAVRVRMRRVAREQARKRMMADLPRATVVITNPTHLAIALRYERGITPAPRIVAKGAGHVAQRIIELARRHAVPVVQRKPLAQALFKVVKVGQEIPTALYHAVAEVLAYVYKLRSAA